MHLPLTEPQRELAAAYVPLARRLASDATRRAGRRGGGGDGDEARGAAHAGVCEAASRFDPSRGVKFATYAAATIKNRIRNARRDDRPRGYRGRAAGRPRVEGLRFDAHGCEQERSGRVLFRRDRPPHAAVDDADEAEALLRKLPARTAEILRRVYLRGETHAEAGRAAGVSVSRAYALCQEASELYRDAFTGS